MDGPAIVTVNSVFGDTLTKGSIRVKVHKWSGNCQSNSGIQS